MLCLSEAYFCKGLNVILDILQTLAHPYNYFIHPNLLSVKNSRESGPHEITGRASFYGHLLFVYFIQTECVADCRLSPVIRLIR